LSAKSWVEVSGGPDQDVKVELVIRDDTGGEARYVIPDVHSVRWVFRRFEGSDVKSLVLTLDGMVNVKTEVRADLTSAEDLLAIIAAGRLVGRDG